MNERIEKFMAALKGRGLVVLASVRQAEDLPLDVTVEDRSAKKDGDVIAGIAADLTAAGLRCQSIHTFLAVPRNAIVIRGIRDAGAAPVKGKGG